MEHYRFSGIDRASFIALLAREGAAGMVNANCAAQPAMIAAYNRWPEVPLVLDSGAFQGNDDINSYIDLVKKVGSRFDWVANLDVIGDQQASNNNWQTLKDAGVNTLWIYQVNGGGDLGQMEDVARQLQVIGIGGLVPVISESVPHAIKLIHYIGKNLEVVGAKAHFFGVGSPQIIREFYREPWFLSADSQSWLCGFKARELIRRDGSRMKCEKIGLSLTGEECASQNIRQIHGWMQGQPLQLALL